MNAKTRKKDGLNSKEDKKWKSYVKSVKYQASI